MIFDVLVDRCVLFSNPNNNNNNNNNRLFFYNAFLSTQIRFTKRNTQTVQTLKQKANKQPLKQIKSERGWKMTRMFCQMVEMTSPNNMNVVEMTSPHSDEDDSTQWCHSGCQEAFTDSSIKGRTVVVLNGFIAEVQYRVGGVSSCHAGDPWSVW